MTAPREGASLRTLVYTGFRRASRDKVRADLDRELQVRGPFRLHVGFDPEKRYPGGGDMHAYFWALENGVVVDTFPVDFEVAEINKAAGPYRNGHSLGKALGLGDPVSMLAHLHPESKGAAGFAAYARSVGVHVWRREA